MRFSSFDNVDHAAISSVDRLHPIHILFLIVQILLHGLGTSFIYVY